MLLFMEGFDTFGAITNEHQGKWQEIYSNPVIASPGRDGSGKCLLLDSASDRLGRNLGTGVAEIVLGFAVRWSGSAGTLCAFRTAGYGTHQPLGNIRVDSTGVPYYSRDWDGGAGIHFGNAALPANAWAYFEAKVKFANSGGEIHFRINGVGAGSATNLDTIYAGSVCNVVLLGAHHRHSNCAPPAGTKIDDLYICDTTGVVNNDFLGDVRVKTLTPISDDLAGFTAVSGGVAGGANFEKVDDGGSGPDGDATYVETDATGTKDRYGISGTGLIGIARGVQVSARAKKLDAGDRFLKLLASSGGVDNASANQGLPSDYAYVSSIFETDPATGSMWETSAVDAGKFGIEAS